MATESVQGGNKKESVKGGRKSEPPKRESGLGGLKKIYRDRFLDQYKKWDENLIERDDKGKKEPKEHRCPKYLDKWKQSEKKDEGRVVEDSKPPTQTLYGFDNEIKSLKLFLLDKKVYKELKSLMIVGEYGVGKTALCKFIFNDEEVKSVYAPRIWVSTYSPEITKAVDPDKEKKEAVERKISVVKKILKGLGTNDLLFETIHEEADEEARNYSEGANIQETGANDTETAEEKELSALLYALHLSLRWKKYLIVFDDVRVEDKWDENLGKKLEDDVKWGKFLSDGFPKGSGGRVIYTTRDEDKVLQEKLVAEKHEIHRLWPLTDTTCVWKIYEDAFEEYGDKSMIPRNDKKCIDELMNKSRGLPLAARMLATLLPVYVDDKK